MESLNTFAKSAQKLSRNPLGIIALFIVLVYGIAALILGVSSANLQPNEKLPIIWFLVVFPIIVLFAFYRLVAHHHVKLYAPLDYQDKEGFFRALTPYEQRKRLEEEIENIEDESKVEVETQVSSDKKATMEVEDSVLKTISTRHSYVLAEELAFRQIENDFGVSIHRQVAVGRDYGIDGIFLRNGKPIAIEIKYVRQPMHLRYIAKREAERFSKIIESMNPKPSFIFVIMVDGISSDAVKRETERMKNIFTEQKLPVEIVVYDFIEMKKKYGVQ